MTQKNKTVFEVFLQSIGLYFSNADKFLQYMFWPVFGQLIGLITIVYSIGFYNKNLAALLVTYPILNTVLYKSLVLFVVLIPGLFIYLKSLWGYFIAYSSVSSMAASMLKSDRLYDMPAHNLMVTTRRLQYFSLWFLYLSILVVSAIPIFWIIGGLLMLYFSFVFQVFVFEPNLAPIDCFKKSSIYVQASFKKVITLIILLTALTYCIIPQIMYSFFKIIRVVEFISKFVAQFISPLSLTNINVIIATMGIKPITPLWVATVFVSIAIWVIVIQLLLPLRSICMCIWYKTYCNDDDVVRKADEKFIKKALSSKKGRRK